MTNICFSVVIPLYNKANFVEKTILSVLKQTYPNYEIIVIDDGSTDGSGELVESMAKKYSCIHYYRQKNQGVSVARNNGMQYSNNDYIAFLDADDVWDNKCLETYREMICTYRDYSAFAVAQKQYRLNNVLSEGKTFIITNHCKYNFLFQTSCLCFKVSALKKIGLFRPGIQIGEDRDYWLRVACKFPFVFCNIELVWHPLETENNLMSIKRIEKEKIFPYWDWYEYQSQYRQNINKYASLMILWQAFAFYNVGQYDDAKSFISMMKNKYYLHKYLYLKLMLAIKKVIITK